MKRRRSREYALQLLFQLELSGTELTADTWNDFWEGIDEGEDVKEFALSIVKSTKDHIQEIDETIQKIVKNWSLERMAVIDRNILRAATYELLYRNDIPHSVVINEALEIAKKYSTIESSSFINGILDKISRSK